MSTSRFGSNALFEWCFHNICLALQEQKIPVEKVEQLIYDGVGTQMYGALFPSEIILLNPTNDINEMSPLKQNVNTKPLSKIIPWLDSLHKTYRNPTIILPLAECRDRFHWTCLIIVNKKSYFFDPKSSLSGMFYSLKHLQGDLASYPLTSKTYCSLQDFSDSDRCGYFVGHIVKHYLLAQLSHTPVKIPEVKAEILQNNYKIIHARPSELYQQFKTPEIVKRRHEEEKGHDEIDIHSYGLNGSYSFSEAVIEQQPEIGPNLFSLNSPSQPQALSNPVKLAVSASVGYKIL